MIASEAGFDYTASLNGNPVAVNTTIVVNTPEYYELFVSRVETASGTEENTLVQFIVRASERSDTEWGLPVFTPYPAIDSAAAEFAGAQLEIVTPAVYPMALEIPVIARVESPTGKRLGVNGRVIASGFETHPLQLVRGVGSVFLPPAAQAGNLAYAAAIHTLLTPKQITIEANTTWQTVSGTIGASTDWGQNGRIQITNNLTIPAGVTLTIGAGSVIVSSPGVEITVTGRIAVNGTNEQPVVFTAANRSAPWGGFLFTSGTSQGDFAGAIFTASGADSGWFNTHSGYFSHRKEQCLFLVSNNAHVSLIGCYMTENKGQIGHGENGYLTMTGCLVQKAVTVGQYNNGSVTFEDSALIEFPPVRNAFVDADNDAIYLSGGPHSFTDCLLGWTLDDGIDAGEGNEGAVTVDGCWFESCIHEAMAWSSGPRYATVIDTVVLNCGQAMESGYGSAFIDATHCFCTSNVIGARFGDNYARSYTGFLDVTNSLLLFNHRDVWGMAWDNWQLHLSQMDIQNNFLSVPNANHPNNTIWDPQNEPTQLNNLAFFLPTDAQTVGIGIATKQDSYDLSELKSENKIPVRLSAFTTSFVSVDYTVSTNLGLLNSGTLNFTPGQTVQQIEFTLSSFENLRQVRISLSSPANAELTNYSQVIFEKPYEIVKPLIVTGDNWRYFKGTIAPPADWKQRIFDDGTWLTGPTPIGYYSGFPASGTPLNDMRYNYTSVYLRKEFEITAPSAIQTLRLALNYDEGFNIWINGTHLSSINVNGEMVPYNDTAPDYISGQTSINLIYENPGTFLVEGTNVMAVQLLNHTADSSDLLFNPALSSVSTPNPGDFEPDGDVDLEDFAVFAQAWTSNDGEGQYNPVCDIDSSMDGSINLLDLEVFVKNWLLN